MALENFPSVMKWVGLSEEGYVDHKDDPGGATNHGITIGTLSKHEGRKVTKAEVKALTKDKAEQILKEKYFDLVRFDELPSGLDYTVVDFAINSGPGRAIKYLQKALGATQDGVFGPDTMRAIRDVGELEGLMDLIESINEMRWAYMKRLRNWPSFKNGWTRRVMGDQIGVQSRDIGVIDRSIMLCTQSHRGSVGLLIPEPKPAHGKADGAASVKSQWIEPEGISKIATGVGVLGGAVADQPILQIGLVAIGLLGVGFLMWRQMQMEPE